MTGSSFPASAILITTLGDRQSITTKRTLTSGFRAPRPHTVCLLSAVEVAKMWKKRQCTKAFLVCVSAFDRPDDNDIRISDVLDGFDEVFEPIPGLPSFRDVNHIIDTGNTDPVSKAMYRMSLKGKAEVERQVKDLLDKGFIQTSNSPYGAPVLFVQKKDGGLRMCIDYRGLNSVTKKDTYPLPRSDELLDRLHGARWFTSLDLQSGCHHIRMDPADVPETAFQTHKGLFEFKVLSCGLTNAPAAFQRVMNKIIDRLPFVLVYLDEILLFSDIEAEHREHVRKIMSILKAQKLYAKKSKGAFFQKSVKFLGHVISANGVRVDPEKIDVIRTGLSPRVHLKFAHSLDWVTTSRILCKGTQTLTLPLIGLTKPNRAFS